MSKLTESLARFDNTDVNAMDEALKKFIEYKKQSVSPYKEILDSGARDISEEYVAYTPILSFALLKSQATMEKLTYWIIWLTVMLVVLAGIQIWLILKYSPAS